MTRPHLFVLVLLLTLVPGLAAAQAEPIEPMPADLRLAPTAGRRTAGPGNGGFCPASVEPLGRADVRVSRLRDVLGLRRAIDGSGSFELESAAQLRTVARMTCVHRGDPNATPWLSAYRQVLVNGADLDDVAIDALLAASLTQTGRTWDFGCSAVRREGETTPRFPLPPLPSGATPDAQLRRELLASLVCEPNRAIPMPRLVYWLDRPGGPGWPGAEMPNVMRASLVRITTHAERHTAVSAPAEVRMGSAFTEWLAGADDAARIDIAEARRELGASGLPLEMQAVALARIHRIRQAALAIGDAWRVMARATPGMLPFVEEIPRQAREAWEAEARAYEPAIAAAYAVETAWLAQDGASLEGCDDRMRAHFLSYAAAQHASTEQAVRALFDRPAGHLIGAAMLRCEIVASHPGRARVLVEILERLAPQRGSRMTVLHAARRALAEAQERDRGFPLRVEPLDPSRVIARETDWIASDRPDASVSGDGIVERAARDGDEVRVTFRRATAQVPVLSCTSTGRIARIDREGRVEYEEHCVRVGERTVDTTPEPAIVPADMMQGLVPGAWLHVQRGVDQSPHGFPLEVRERPGAAPIAYLGVSLQ